MRWIGAVQRADPRLHLRRGTLMVVMGAVCLAVFGDTTEDVSHRNGLTLHDAGTLRAFTTHRSDALVSAAKLVSDAGSVAVVGALAIIASVILWRRGVRAALALAPVASFGVTAVVVATTKHVVGRARPPLSLHLVAERDASFPSGHATDSAAVLITIALVLAVFVLRRPSVRVLVVLAAVLLTGMVGVSRLVLGVHWPTDVFAGWALGVSVALLVTGIAATLPASMGVLARVRDRSTAP